MCVGGDAAVADGERLSSMARLALFFRFVIGETRRKKSRRFSLLERIIVSNNNYLLGIIGINNKYLIWIILSKLLSGTINIWINVAK